MDWTPHCGLRNAAHSVRCTLPCACSSRHHQSTPPQVPLPNHLCVSSASALSSLHPHTTLSLLSSSNRTCLRSSQPPFFSSSLSLCMYVFLYPPLSCCSLSPSRSVSPNSFFFSLPLLLSITSHRFPLSLSLSPSLSPSLSLPLTRALAGQAI